MAYTYTRSYATRHHRVAMLARQILEELDAEVRQPFGGGRLNASAYETAWVALVRDRHRPKQLAFPEALAALLQMQEASGAWGKLFPYTVLPTMAALLALCRSPTQTKFVQQATQSAIAYLQSMTPSWSVDDCDTPFIEFLIPNLCTCLEENGITIPFVEMEKMADRRRAKLQRIPLDGLYTGNSNLIYALEVLGPQLDFTRLRARQTPDGGYGYSPSATAAVLLYAPGWDAGAAAWLRYLTQRSFGGYLGAMPPSFPAEMYEVSWSLYHLLASGLPLVTLAPEALAHLQRVLQQGLTPRGASFGRALALPPDVDDTAMAITVLNRLGSPTPVTALWPFAAGQHFATYAGERTSSSSANAHVLEALRSAVQPLQFFREQGGIVQYLLTQRCADGSWTDKWCLSPMYATMSVVLALVRHPSASEDLVSTLYWLFQRQQTDGSFGSTIEETAYAVMTLKALAPIVSPEHATCHRECLRRSQNFLWHHLDMLDHPEQHQPLWIAKDLYGSHLVRRSAVIAALSRSET